MMGKIIGYNLLKQAVKQKLKWKKRKRLMIRQGNHIEKPN